MRTLWTLLIGLWGLCLAQSAWAAETQPVDTGEVLGQVVSSYDAVTPGQSFHIAVSTVLNEGWHTYWVNPGDSGEPFDVTLDPVEGAKVGDLIWPLPKPVPTGPIVNYGFEGAPLFVLPVTADDNAQPGDTINFSGQAYYLVCREICIPESFDFSLDVTIADAPIMDGRWERNIRKAIETAPVAKLSKSTARVEGGKLVIETELQDMEIRNPYIYPIQPGTILHSDPQVSAVGERGARVALAPGFNIKDPVEGPIAYLLGYDIKTDAGWMPSGHFAVATPGAALDLGLSTASKNTPSSGYGLMGALFAALLGGIILNIMPCVFPVISMKALSFARHAHEDRSIIRRQGWLYTAGVVATFLILTAVLLAVKAGGAQLGWGFQLQSPWLVGLLALLIFAIGLNLLGAFEISAGPLANLGAGTQSAFWTGALAAIVATPCTAPFMAGAVGYALASSALVTILIFMGLAIGFALPVLLLSYMPGLLARLPAPGPWMERFKQVLAFPMFAAAIWLVWVVNLQAGSLGLIKILGAMLALGFGIWLLAGTGKLSKILSLAALFAAIATPLTLTAAPLSTSVSQNASYTIDDWSPQNVREYQAQGRAVFVDFTAAWCVTCKVNEMTALSSDDVKAAFADTNTVFLIGDWTNKNDEIAQELASHGRAGVPLYLYYGVGNNGVSPDILPQILTKDVLLKTLKPQT